MIKLEEISYRVGQAFYEADKTRLKGASMLVYIDARTCDRELTDKYGTGWRFSWNMTKGWGVKGRLEIWDNNIKDWIFREDVGYPQDTKMVKAKESDEWLKDAVSDARKRCAVQYGIGRFLYDAPFFYLEAGMFKISKDKAGKEYLGRITDEGERMMNARVKEWFGKLTDEQKGGKNG